MRLNPERKIAFQKLFGNVVSVSVVIDHIAEQGFKTLPENETVLQHWTTLFGNKGKQEAIALLKRVKRYKDYDFVQFRFRMRDYMTTPYKK